MDAELERWLTHVLRTQKDRVMIGAVFLTECFD
jgi:hypothetical protein